MEEIFLQEFTRPEAVSSTEVERIGGLRSLTKTEREKLSKIISCNESEITNQPLVRIVTTDGEETPDFADIVTLLMDQVPQGHARSKFKDFFVHPHHDAPVVKGIVPWNNQNNRDLKSISVYYQYYW